MDKQTAQVLRAAKALIEQPEKWGRWTKTNRPGTYCAVEAVEAVTRASPLGEVRATAMLRRATKSSNVLTWNDARNRTHAQVMAAFDKAIALAEGGILMDPIYLIALFGGGVWGFLFCDWYRARQEARKQPAEPPVTGHVTHDVARLSHHIDVEPHPLATFGPTAEEAAKSMRQMQAALAKADPDNGLEIAWALRATDKDIREEAAKKRANRAIIDGANAPYTKRS